MSYSFANEIIDIKNLVINKELKKYDSLTFLDAKNKQLNLNNFQGNLILLNFWATWCAPCKEEMPSLDLLKNNKNLNNIKIFPINVGQDNIEKASKFFEDLKIKNLELYFDTPITLAKKFGLRGIPTSILINKKGEEFARIVGSIDFEDDKFIEWLSNYNQFLKKYAKPTKAIIAINCNKTLNCINLLEYFLLVSPPLNKVPIPSKRTIPTAINKTIDNILTNIPEIIIVLQGVL